MTVQELVSTDIMTEDSMRGKYMCFAVKDGDYGIEISYVTEIIEVQDITHLPNTHEYIKGITNLRGTIVPVIDMRLRFGYEEIAYTDRTCIIVLSMDGADIGIIVDEVQEVLEIDDSCIQPPPRIGSDSISRSFIKVIGISGDKVMQIVDINRVFEVDDY
jgi:purine-binding chemotaxis protein CheW